MTVLNVLSVLCFSAALSVGYIRNRYRERQYLRTLATSLARRVE